jgi:hypothetical protein
MLSPNATNLVARIFGGAVMVIENEHESVRCRLSVAVQATLLEPTEKVDPLAGTHAVVTGDSPPAVVAVP